jgi:hypothetical protein
LPIAEVIEITVIEITDISSSQPQIAEPYRDCLGAVPQSIAPKDSVDVRPNSRIGDSDLSSDLLVGEALGHQGQNLRLTRRKILVPCPP